MFNFRLFSKSVYGFFLLLVMMTALSLGLQAATFTVTKIADTNDGVCDADCSLREAVAAANVAATDDVIEFSSVSFNTAQIITLTNSGLSITNNGSLILNGSGSSLITVSGNNSFGVLFIGGGSNVIINGITISNGRTVAPGTSGEGGGIGNFGTLTINNSIVKNNFATFQGGGIYNNGTLSINKSAISNNSSQEGGGIFHQVGTVTITDSDVSGNSSSFSSGGGISTRSLVNITGSTIRNNGGGGLYNYGGLINLTNSTVSNNSKNNVGGGITNEGGTTNLINSTVAFNSSTPANGGGVYHGGGIVNARNSIIAGNTGNSNPSDFAGTLTSQGYNLIGSTSFANITGNTTGNIVNVDAQLVPLGNYGGATQTVALMPNSPAIDAADPNNFPATDQRGVSRPQDGDLNGTALPDIGAYERQVTIFTVTKIDDTNDGVCDADCSLREAITTTNTATSPDNKIDFASSSFNTARTITLTNGQLSINSSGTLIINGTRAGLLTISGNNQTRILLINSGASVVISDVAVINGKEDFGNGGGIYNSAGMLTLTNAFVCNNSSSDGGGIKNDNGTLNIINSTISANSGRTGGGGISNSGTRAFLAINNSIVSDNSTESGGGGIVNDFGTAVINNSVISSNQVTYSGSGGGIFFRSGRLTVTNSTIHNNLATDSGGGVRISSSDSPVLMTNSTISNNKASNGGGMRSDAATVIFTNSSITGNMATFRGGGIVTSGSTLTLTASIINNNSATNAGGGIAHFGTLTVTNSTVTNNSSMDAGGGIYNGNGPVSLNYSTISHNSAKVGGGMSGSVSLRNSIISDNTATGAASDYSGTINSQGFNLIENINGATITGISTGNIFGQDPLLGSLADNGGPTLTRALLPGSPAIDAGDQSNILPADQRGFTRPRDGDGNGVARTDIGAFEVRTVVVANTNSSGAGSLGQAITDVLTQGDAVVFNANVFGNPKTITLTDGEIVIPNNANFTINGRGADRLTISGNNRSRVFSINAGANVVIDGLTITGGNGTGSINNGHDGGISNFGSLRLSNSIVSNNSANGNGGGIGNYLNGTLIVTNSTIRNNSTATIAGGGIFNQSGQANINNSTINNNSAAGDGGGVINISGKVELTNSTISGNVCGGGGGGISNFSDAANTIINNSTISNNTANNSRGGGILNNGSFSSQNSIVADNTVTGFGSAPDFSGILTSQGYNLIENTDRIIITGTTTGNILGQDPQLLPLGNYGGATQTQALRMTSPAIDKGGAVTGISTDQRGFVRPFDFSSIPNVAGGNGSDIGAFERQSTDVNRNTFFDFDGDGKADLAVYRPSEGNWYVSPSTRGGYYATIFGVSTDKPVPADYDGDGITDLAIYRPSEGNWYISPSARGGYYATQFGNSTDIPVPADYDGDGKTDLAVYRPSEGNWYISPSTRGGYYATVFGVSTDQPVPADYDGDGKTDLAVYRPSEGNWYISPSTRGGYYATVFGVSTDQPVAADYDGDGKADLAVYRPSEGNWYVSPSTRGGYFATQFGVSTDLPVPADYDGDGKTDLAVYRPSEGSWYISPSTRGGYFATQFGNSTDIPIQRAFRY